MSVLFNSALKNSKEFNQLLKSVEEKISPIAVHGLWDSVASHVISSLGGALEKQVLVLCPTESEAKKIQDDLKLFYGEDVYHFPAKEVVFFDVYAHSFQLIEERVKIIKRLLTKEKCIITMSVEGLFFKMMDPEAWLGNQMKFAVGERLNLVKMLTQLVDMGYERCEMVEGRGHFSLRGGIIDIFPANSQNPYRIELFDDEIDSIRLFNHETQKSIENIQETIIYPSREIIIGEKERARGIEALDKEIKSYSDDEAIKGKLQEVKEKLEQGMFLDNFENYFNYLFDNSFSLIDYMEEAALKVIINSERCTEKATWFRDDYEDRFKNYLENGTLSSGQYNGLYTFAEIIKILDSDPMLIINNLQTRIKEFDVEQIINFKAHEAVLYHGKIDDFVTDLEKWKYRGYKVVIVSGTEERARRFSQELKKRDVYVPYCEDADKVLSSGESIVISGHLRSGYEFNTFKLIVITEQEIFGANKKKKSKVKDKNARAIKSFRELTVGDLVVHENHGIGKYVGIEQLAVESTKKDYIKIKYTNEDFLYIPIEQMDLIQKYIGAEAKAIKLHKLGGVEWKNTKSRVKKAIEDMTDELLNLYAIRKKATGHQFSQDTDWQKQLEDLFPYEETPDQLKCIEEIKKDMESQMPMDRLLCGDVGFGKTEVAIRAIFKAVMDSKQVGVLVPTTILASQHYESIKERFSKFPAKVEMLSRFRTKKQQEKIAEDLRTGVVDVVVGTHRILSKDVNFKDIGLLIIDEEQRFGVKHKEKIKQFKNDIDVLSLSATPVPRTLHMSLVGIRDMSLLEDPPEDRYPIQTYVTERDESVIRDAISRELDRGGQVFYVHNRVHDIDQVAGRLKQLVPEAQVVFAHGQMSERKLEQIMIAFLNHEFDVLVCTTIIETGLDIANCNTIIIDDADKMGLSQLYQLRGRVGRSNRLAYAYLTYKKDKVLNEIAEKRLKAIKDFTELGAGFKIAMRDLEIRGAGNLLGSEQHGHLASIGYELYCKMLEETVGALKGNVIEEVMETSIEFRINAFIPSEYVENQKYKLEFYKKISSIRDKEDAYNIADEIEDRYGTLPQSVYNLISISLIKAYCQKLKIASMVEQRDRTVFEFLSNDAVKPEIISKIGEKFGRRVSFDFIKTPKLIYFFKDQKASKERKIQELERFFDEVFK